MALSATVFSACVAKLDALLSVHGFTRDKVTLDGAFGSHCASFAKGGHTLDVLWDGKEEWIIIRNDREELFFRKLGRTISDADIESCIAAALATLQHHFSTVHDHDDDGQCCGHHHG